MKNGSFIKLSIATTFTLGFFNIYIVIVNEYFSYYGLKQKEITIISAISYSSGVIGSVFLSIVADRTKKYKLILIVLNIVLLLNHFVMTILMEFVQGHNFYFILVLIVYGITGFSLLSLITISVDLACEITFPIGESLSVGFMISCSRVLGFASVNYHFKLEYN